MQFNKEDDVILNLQDAGCNEQAIAELMTLYRSNDLDSFFKKLFLHRNCLLDHCHCEEKKIDCLDYLIFNLKK